MRRWLPRITIETYGDHARSDRLASYFLTAGAWLWIMMMIRGCINA